MDGRTDICLTLRCKASGLGLFFGTVQHIMVDALHNLKVCDRWMSHALTEDYKAQNGWISSASCKVMQCMTATVCIKSLLVLGQ
jgi:hypothetical protein